MFAGVELDEVTGRQRGTAPPAGERPLAPDDIALEPEEGLRARADKSVLAVDDAAHLGGVEYLAGERGVGGERLDAVDRVRERQFGVLGVGEQRHPQFDRVRTAPRSVTAALVVFPVGRPDTRRSALVGRASAVGAVPLVGRPDTRGSALVGVGSTLVEVVESGLFVVVVGHTVGVGRPPQSVCRRGSDAR